MKYISTPGYFTVALLSNAHTIQIISRHEQLQAQFSRDVDIRHVLGVLVFLVVVEILANFLEHKAAAKKGKRSRVSLLHYRGRWSECWMACQTYLMFSKRQVLVLDSAKPSGCGLSAALSTDLGGCGMGFERTGRVEHAFDGATDAG